MDSLTKAIEKKVAELRSNKEAKKKLLEIADQAIAAIQEAKTQEAVNQALETALAVMAVSTLAVLDVFLPGGLIDIAGLSTDELPTARTAAFSTLVLAQLFNTLNSRSETVSALHHLFVNKWLWGAIALGAVLQIAVVEVPVLQVAFSTEPLDPTHWAVVVAMASLVLWVGEIRKAVRRARGL